MAARAVVAEAFSIAPAGQAGSGRFALTGTVGFATATTLLARGRSLFAACPTVELDMAAVQSIDSAGLALLLCWMADAKSAGRAFHLHNLPAQLHALARISDVESLLTEPG